MTLFVEAAPMFETLSWLFVGAVALHNLEEAIWLPAWSRTVEQWHSPVSEFEFRFAVAVLTLLAAGAAWLAVAQGSESLGAYLVSGYALAMLINVILPHVAATVGLRTYAPGTATALIFIAPVTILLIREGLESAYITLATFILVGPAIVFAIAVTIPVLLKLGSWLRR